MDDTPAHWLTRAWHQLPDRQRDVLIDRSQGHTLQEAGDRFGFSRERARQLQGKALQRLQQAIEENGGALFEKLRTILAGSVIISRDELTALLDLPDAPESDICYWAAGAATPRFWTAELVGFLTIQQAGIDAVLETLVNSAPLEHADLESLLNDGGIELEHFAVSDRPGQPLERTDWGWIRGARRTRDLSLLWLRHESEPRSAHDVALVVGSTERATREVMRRDPAFAQVRPEGTWSLSDWKVAGAEGRYASAVQVLVEVLTERGALSFDQLRAEVQRRYPVSTWRVQQCLASDEIGKTAEGLVDLVERGAVPIEDAEPQKPDHIQAVGPVIGVRLAVDQDMLRGSGIPVHRWLTWHLGLRTAPSSRYFRLPGELGEVTVRRGTSNSQLSTLRAVATALRVREGCQVTLLLRTDSESADVLHSCAPESCVSFAEVIQRLSCL